MSKTASVLGLFVAALAGLFVSDSLWPEGHALPVWPCAIACCAAVSAALWRQRGTVVVALCTTALLFGCNAAQLRGPPLPSAQALVGIETLWRVHIDTTPVQNWPAAPKRGLRTVVSLRAQQRDGMWHPEEGRADVTLWAGPEVARGDELLVRLMVRPLRDAAPPWGDSLMRVMRRRSISAQALVCGPHALAHRNGGLWSASDHARQRSAARLQRLLPARLAGIAQALALGDTQALALDQRDAWGDAGVAHLLAVSGLHVGLVARAVLGCAWALLAAVGPLAERVSLRRIASLSALPFVWAYALFTGGAVSALRAAVMVTLVLVGHGLGRGSQHSAHGLGIAGLVLLWLDPLAAQSASFWLSFASVACLLGGALMPWRQHLARVQSFIDPSGSRGTWVHLCASLGTALGTGLVAAVGTAPLCALFFGRLSVVAPLTNLVAVPLGSLVATPLCIATALLSAMLPEHHTVVRLFAWACTQALSALDVLAVRTAKLPWAALQASPLTEAAVVACCVGLALCWGAGMLRHHGIGLRMFAGASQLRMLCWGLCACLGCATCVWGQRLYSARQQAHVLTVWHLDVAQGDSTLISLPHGGWVLVDGGGASYAGQSDPGRWAVAQALRAQGVTRLEAVVLTHPHPDHMGGLAHVLERWPTQVFYRTEESHQEPLVRGLEASVLRYGGRVELPPPTLQWGAVTVRAFMPLMEQQASVNDHSIVLELTYRERRMLLMGDAEQAAERDLLPKLRPVDVVKVGHHGSRTSTSLPFVRRVRPKLAVVSCGPFNRFGHPHAVTLATLAAAATSALRTDVLGPLCLRTDGLTPFTWAARSTSWKPQD